MPPGLDEDELMRRVMHLVIDSKLDTRTGLATLAADALVEGHEHPAEGDEDREDEADMLFVESFRTVTSVPRSFKKGRRRPRAVSTVTTVVVHQTDVEGGFGVSKRLREGHGGDVQAARRVRYRDTPYHGVYAPQDRASIVQWPAWAYTFHGNGGNREGVGWAYDGSFPGDELDAGGARAALRHFVIAMRDAGAPLRYVEAHRQHADDRGRDPGERIWREVVMALLDELDLELQPKRTTGGGRSLPSSWLG